MTNSDRILDRIVLEFPENKREITTLFNKNIDFIEVCEDYIVCMNSIHELKKMGNIADEKNINELGAVSIELRDELLSMI